MTCDEALAILLEAELSELRPGADTEVGRHLEACARCRRAARLVRRGSVELDRWLDGADAPPRLLDVQSILDRAAVPEAPGPGGVAPDGPRRDASRAPGRREWALRRGARWGLPLAAAAALASVLLLREPGELPPPSAPAPEAPANGADLALDVPAPHDAAVLHTGNPDITVVWIYGGDS